MVDSAAISGANPADFVISADGCTGATLPPSGTCTVDVSFAPTALGARSASLAVSTPSAGAEASLSGTGE